MRARKHRPFEPLPAGLTEAPDEAERAVLEEWRARDVFAEVAAARADAPPFVFWEGPPTANGKPGIHHVLARSVKDTVCRYRTMRGERVLRKAGWDTHGLPVELEVEKQLGLNGKREIEEYGVAEFNARCRESVWTYRQEWEQLSERIGYWLDYENPYVTYEPEYVESVWYLLSRFHAAGLAHHGRRVVPYCGRCGTGLSTHEMGQPDVYREVRDPAVTVRLRLCDAGGDEPESLLAWTTTPWTLPSNFAVAVHPELEYVRARVPLEGGGSEVLWVVAERAAAVLGEGFEELERRRGAELEGLRYEPLFEMEGPWLEPPVETVDAGARHRVYVADFVSAEEGTGLVHQAPYGADDWALATRIRAPSILGVGADGRFALPVGPVEPGTFFKDADAALVRDLDRRGLLFRREDHAHSYPHCWRCATPLYYFPTSAWFLRTSSYKDRMLEYNRRCTWVPPEVGAGRFGDWLENNVDWNVSRDRYWGTPLPFWVCDGCGAERAVGGFEELAALAGGLPEGFDGHKPLADEITFPCEACDGTMRRTPAVIDCWFDSGAMPFAQHHWPFGDSRAIVAEQFPASFIAEGLDQTRGWFYSLLAIGAFVAEDDPELPKGVVYRSCAVNGLVLDKAGVKMSKRLGNAVDPWEEIARHGADALRWYLLAGGSSALDRRYDPEGILQVRRRVFGTLANTYKFLADYARIDGFDPAAGGVPPVAERPEIDRWLASRTASVVREARERMDAIDVAGTLRALEGFVLDELSNWYVRRNRRRFWRSGLGPDKRSAYATLHGCLHALARLVAPFAPFLAEALWSRLDPSEASVHCQLYPEPDAAAGAPDLERAMELVQRAVELGRAWREAAGLRVRQPLARMTIASSDRAALALLGEPFARGLVADELNVKELELVEAEEGDWFTLRAKPDWRALGRRLGPRMKAAAAAIAALPSEAVRRLRSGEAIALELEGGAIELAPSEVQVAVETHVDFAIETDGHLIVHLDPTLDDALVAEGLAREAVSRINGLRKERGLALDQRIRLVLAAESETLRAALAAHRAWIGDETLAAEVEVGLPEAIGAEAPAWELGEGLVLRAELRPVGAGERSGPE